MLFDTLASIFKRPLPDHEKVRLAQKEIETESNVLVGEMLEKRPRLDPARIAWFSEEQVISLSKARTNEVIWDRGGRGLFVRYFDGSPDNTRIRFNDIVSPLYPINSGWVKGAFLKILLTNTAQAGKSLKFIVGYRNFAEFQMLGTASVVQMKNILGETIDPATTQNITALKEALEVTSPTIINVVMTNADEEHSQVLPEGTKKLNVTVSDGTAVRVAWVAGQVAADSGANWNIHLNGKYERDNLNLTGKTLYFACGTAGKILKIETWT